MWLSRLRMTRPEPDASRQSYRRLRGQAGGEQEQEEEEEAEGSRGTRCSSATSKGLHKRVHGKDFPAASPLPPHPSGCGHRRADGAPGSRPGSEESDEVLGLKSRRGCTGLTDKSMDFQSRRGRVWGLQGCTNISSALCRPQGL